MWSVVQGVADSTCAATIFLIVMIVNATIRKRKDNQYCVPANPHGPCCARVELSTGV